MKLAFAMFDMPHWHEDWENQVRFDYLYNALYGYSFCFDPYVLTALGEVPAFVELKKLRANLGDFDVLVSPQRNLTEALYPLWPKNKPALWVDPPAPLAVKLCGTSVPQWVPALRERLLFTPDQDAAFLRESNHSSPSGFWPFEPKTGDNVIGTVGERPIWIIRGNAGYASINHLFRLVVETMSPDNVAAFITAYLRTLLGVMGNSIEKIPPVSGCASSLRRDFHAFGACLELVAYGLREAGQETSELANSNAPLLRAARHAINGEETEARKELKSAFQILEAVRERHLPFQRGCIDIPHAGILLPDGANFELEWPELTRNYLVYMADLAETLGYRFSIEYNVGSLVQTARRHPEIIRRLGRLWRENKIEIVNGSWAGPLQQFSNLELAAREFELGGDALEKLFGRRCETYTCQEFSMMPSFPGLLRDFGYKRAAHVAQLRGQVPENKHNHFSWRGKDGRVISALGHHALDLCKRGNNFYIEWPVMFMGCLKQGLKALDSYCAQDQSLLPFREDMVRAESYAPVLGRHVTLADVLPDGPDSDLPVESYPFDEYTFEKAINGPISENWISMFEQLLHYAHRTIRVESMAARAGLEDVSGDLRAVWEWLLCQESHDHLLCPRGTTGDFYYRHLSEHSGPHFDVNKDFFANVLLRQAPALEASLAQIEENALGNLGLRKIKSAKMPRRIVLHNPQPQTLEPGGWFPWTGPDFHADGESVQLSTLSGRCYWTGALPAGAIVELSTVNQSAKKNQTTTGNNGWKAKKGAGATILLARKDGTGTPLNIIPVDGKKSIFKLKELKSIGSADLEITHALWAGKDTAGHETVVKIDFVQMRGNPFLNVHVSVDGYKPSGEDKDADALRLRISPKGRLKGVQYFVSHFVEGSRKRIRTSSPYVALAETAHGSLSLMNRGSIWHQRGNGFLDAILMVPHETVNKRDFSFGWGLAHPVTTAIRQMDQPVLAETSPKIRKGKGIVNVEMLESDARGKNIWISSLRPDGQVRISETEGIASEVALNWTPKPARIRFLGERGRSGEILKFSKDGSIRFKISAYESVAIEIK